MAAYPKSGDPNSRTATYAILVTNLAATTRNVTASWNTFGFSGDAIIRDLWSRTNLVAHPNANGGYKFTNDCSFILNTRQSTLIKVTPLAPVTQYLADAPANTVTGGTQFSRNNAATNGRVASLVGNGGSIIFNNIRVRVPGTYTVDFLYFNSESSRPASIRVNGGSPVIKTFPGTGSFQAGTFAMQLHLEAGINSLAITAPGSNYAPDFDSINIPAPTTQYLADAAVLSGSQIAVAARTVCTDGKCVTNVGHGNSLTFNSVYAGAPGKTKVIFLYLTGVERSADILVNGGKPLTINFPATGNDSGDFTRVGAITIELPLSPGKNSITIANQHAPAPDFDSILVAD